MSAYTHARSSHMKYCANRTNQRKNTQSGEIKYSSAINEHKTLYETDVQSRSVIRYYIGLIVRWKQQWKYKYARYIARKNGASIGEGVIMPISLARKANKNLTIGSHTSIASDNFSSLRYPVKIGSHVIVGNNAKFVMGSHRLDTPNFEHFRPNSALVIDDYVWLCPDSVILPSVSHIGKGCVLGANSVAVKDMKSMTIYGGNPAKELSERKCLHYDLVVESLMGGDYKIYKKTRKGKR